MFFSENQGRIIIKIEKEYGSLNSKMQLKGCAETAEIALSTLMVHFISLATEQGKDPKKIFEANYEALQKKLTEINGKKDTNSSKK
ncbi:MAG: hypothetical protein JJU28_18270 [Cyclobacteriaceae bacterium]|nr:hypothetical protein [Cyclobacteriaceae bacterium]